jgi:hypothetical protein
MSTKRNLNKYSLSRDSWCKKKLNSRRGEGRRKIKRIKKNLVTSNKKSSKLIHSTMYITNNCKDKRINSQVWPSLRKHMLPIKIYKFYKSNSKDIRMPIKLLCQPNN